MHRNENVMCAEEFSIIDNEAIRAHLSIMQSVIQRMNGNSTSCKTWCVTLVSAMLVFMANKGTVQYVLIALIPTFLFFTLDVYYLWLEKRFRRAYELFVEKLHMDQLVIADLYKIAPEGKKLRLLLRAIVSITTLPFYFILSIMLFIVKLYYSNIVT